MSADRATFADSLRTIADLLDSTPDLPKPDVLRLGDGGMPKVEWNVWDEEPAPRIAELVRLIGGKWDKNAPTTEYQQKYYRLTRDYQGVELEIATYRDRVCERVVTGTREVTEEVAVQTAMVTRTEDVVEWRCHPLLAEAVSA